MRQYAGLILGAFVLAAAPAHAEAPTCASLQKLKLADTTITAAAEMTRFSTAATADFPAVEVTKPFCRVSGVIKPAIKFEVWLPPAASWNGRFQGVGVGGMAGAISHGALKAALDAGFAGVASNLGHDGGYIDGSFAIGRPDLVVDWGHRAVHEMTVKGKEIAGAFYGKAPRYSYFTGCSGGGREGLMEAQRYPGDYDGILAGDPTIDFTRLTAGGRLWAALVTLRDDKGAGYFPQSKVPALAAAVNAQCDALDGVADGVLEDPRRCRFDPAAMQCKGKDTAECLTAAQVTAVRKIYAGSSNAAGKIYPGYERGGELGPGGWARYFSGEAPFASSHWNYASGFVKGMIFEDLSYDPLTFNFEDMEKVNNKPILGQPLQQVVNATDADLARFKSRGGKLIHYHGWSDPGVAPARSIAFYDSVVQTSGTLGATQDFYRLFMVPGMQHCSGGPGTTDFDGLAALQAWVEEGKAPERIVAARVTNGAVARTRPLCPYPQTAHWKGAGSTDDAASFECRAAAKD